MNLEGVIEAAKARRRAKERRDKIATRYFSRVPEEVVMAIEATRAHAKAIGKMTGNSEPSDDELQQLWVILKQYV